LDIQNWRAAIRRWVATAGFFRRPFHEALQPVIVATRNSSQTHLALTVRTADVHAIPAQGGVQINDYSAELAPEDIEVEVLGIRFSFDFETARAIHRLD
jgi:hypothetical protein